MINGGPSDVSGGEISAGLLVYGDYKDVLKYQTLKFIAKDYDIVLRVDIQGMQKLRKVLGKLAVFIFLVAESEAMMGRG
ncbi:hypothetical protein Ahy_B02g060673 [Arachis hypogaea]|uniref:Uncharacterized protein n=1 Tax=Arachis hypogaea TaxID=3818 RepID=A0A445AJ21_ARAHY|nr:hypothetical protein Ahy_B02g060673 [Arachis hypogaea]